MMRAKSVLHLLLLFSVIIITPLASGQDISNSAYWKNEIVFPDDSFRVTGTSSADPGWIKFTILLPPYDPNIVYFQDCNQYVFHYDFATNELDPFLGISRLEFDRISLYHEGQQAVFGAVILPPTGGYPVMPAYPEYGIQFVGRDAYTAIEVRDMFRTVKAAVVAEESVRAFYFPSYEQIQSARDNQEWLESEGISISSPAKWAQGNVCYSQGWALGELKYFGAGEIEDAYMRGELTANDILLTDGIPAEIPMVAGVISLAPATPNSHVAILARTFGVPFVHLALEQDAQRAKQLAGHMIVLRVYETWDSCEVRLIDADGVIDEDTVAEILDLKSLPELNISPVTTYRAFSANTDVLGPRDIKYFGGKAANYGILRKSVADNSPVAAAFSFDLWNAFVDQGLANGNSLRQEIEQRLMSFEYPPVDMAALSSTLDDIRDMFRDDEVTTFSLDLQEAVIAALSDPQYGFDPNRKIRFRSSTNVEDSDQFTGAGLYDSYSGCLADDLDGDENGPCACDPQRANERGVFRAIRRVFASFYNDNAYLERLRWDVNENEVGMAVLVHHSFPDEIELANGVATVTKSYPSSSWRDIDLVTQFGATSVSNPVDGSIPEEVNVSVYSTSYYATLLGRSNLVPFGDTVMGWQDDYLELSQMLVDAGNLFEAITGTTTYVLDFEYKKIAPDGKLIIKQIRQIPQPRTEASITPFVINDPADYSVFQGEYGNIFANHRLKSLWKMQTKSFWLTDKNLSESFYADTKLEYLHGCKARTRIGPIASWDQHTFKVDVNKITESWLFDEFRNSRSYQLETTNIAKLVSPAQSPILTLCDFGYLTLQVDYETALPSWDWTGPIMTTTDTVILKPKQKPHPGDKLQTRTYRDDKNGISITTSFYWPPEPTGPVAGYTAPLNRWVKTVINGLTSEPVELVGDYSQTYLPGHHNFTEQYMFEPCMEEGISPQILNELRLKNIRMILLNIGWENGITIYGFEKGFSAADLDGDGNVNAVDLGLFEGNWRKTGCDLCGGADLTGDGNVGLEDFSEFAIEWLSEYY